MKKKFYLLMASFLVFATLISSVSAFGVSRSYLEKGMLILQPGQTMNFHYTLQNMMGDSDLLVTAALTNGSEIAQITDTTTSYLVKKGTANTTVNLRLSVPSDATIGTVQEVTITFTATASGAGPGVKMGTAIEENINVVVGKVVEKGIETWMLVVGAIAIVLILILLLKPKKKARRR